MYLGSDETDAGAELGRGIVISGVELSDECMVGGSEEGRKSTGRNILIGSQGKA